MKKGVKKGVRSAVSWALRVGFASLRYVSALVLMSLLFGMIRAIVLEPMFDPFFMRAVCIELVVLLPAAWRLCKRSTKGFRHISQFVVMAAGAYALVLVIEAFIVWWAFAKKETWWDHMRHHPSHFLNDHLKTPHGLIVLTCQITAAIFPIIQGVLLSNKKEEKTK